MVTAGYAGDEAAEGGAEIVGGEVLTGEEIGEVAGEFIGGAGLGVFAGVVGTEVWMVGGARSAALAAIGEGETTQGLAVLWAKRGHGCLLKLELK
jgi:formylmethanofuran:tetrahydromethanopterin formyltransferase